MSGSNNLSCNLINVIILCLIIPLSVVNAKESGLCLALDLDDKVDIIPGEVVDISIATGGRSIYLSEFDLRIAFNSSVMTVAGVVPGSYYENYNWEYFDYRLLPPDESRPDSLSGVLRIKSIADLDDNDETPTGFELRHNRPIVHIIFNTADDSLLENTRQPIRFYWTGCGDNILRSVQDDTIFISHEVRDPHTGNNITDNTLMPTIQGAPDVCLTGDGPDYDKAVVREVNYFNGYIAFGSAEMARPFEIKIEMAHDQLTGHHTYIDVTKEKGTGEIHGFDFLIGYDAAVLTCMGAIPGDLFHESGDYQWEYFTFRYEMTNDGIPNGLLRTVALAETNNGAHHPLSMIVPDGMTLFTLDFIVKSNLQLEGTLIPVDFYWLDCGDNAIAFSNDPDTSDIKTALSKQVYKWQIEPCNTGYHDVTDPDVGFPTYTGAQMECFENPIPGKPLPEPMIIFYGGGVDVIGTGDPDPAGDVNLNGIANEIADFVLFKNQLLSCNYDQFTVGVEAQKAATEIIPDGIPMDISDLVYMARIIIGDAEPICPIDSTYAGEIMITEHPETILFKGAFAEDVGGIYIMYQLDSTTITDVGSLPGLQDMTLEHGICHDTLKILIYDLGMEKIAAVENIPLMTINYTGKTPELIGVTAAGYDGRKFDLYVEEPFGIKIDVLKDQLPGHHTYIDVTKEKGSGEIHGFDFLIGYDQSRLNFMGTAAGELFNDWGEFQWEYFTYRYNYNGDCGDNCPSGLLRVVALAETNNGAHHPLSVDVPDGFPLFTMDFVISSDYQLQGTFIPVDFYWMDCGDNVMSFVKYGSPESWLPDLALSRKVYRCDSTGCAEVTDFISGFPTYSGTQEECFEDFNLENPVAMPIVDYYGGGVEIKDYYEESRGDVNLNGIYNEIADFILFKNQLLSCNYDLFTVSVEGQTEATDVNKDDIPMTIEDLVYLSRVIIGDALPLTAIDSAFSGAMELYDGGSWIYIDASFDMDVGGIYLIYRLNGSVVQNVSFVSEFDDMSLDYDVCEDSLKILIYSLEQGSVIPAGDYFELLEIRYSGETPELILASAAGYYGRQVDLYVYYEGPVDAGEDEDLTLPTVFSLYQNYPNPFNPITRIMFDLPERAEWSIDIYNIAGQKVKSFTGSNAAGRYRISWDGADANGNAVGSGIYLYRIEAGDFVDSKKMILIK